MRDPLPAITESEATGVTAEIFADIRRVYKVGVVNLIDSTGTLTVTGISDATGGGSVTVNNSAGSINITGPIGAGANAVNLTASSSITQGAAAAITGGLLTTSSATGANLSTSTNAVTSFHANSIAVSLK